MDYLLPENLSPEAFRERLQDFAAWEIEPELNRRRLFLDSFDWRLFQKNLVLEELTEGRKTHLQLRELGSWRPIVKIEARPQRFVGDLPAGELREILEKILEMRCLLPLAATTTHSRPLRILNKDQKTVVRLSLDEHRVETVKRETIRQLPTRVRLLPIRGYEKSQQKLDDYLQRDMGLASAERSFWYEAMQAAGLRPGDYSSKLKLQLEPTQTAFSATRQILLHLLETMERNLDGVVRNLDSEFLHDLRVAVRRTRSALGQIKGVLPTAIPAKFNPEFAWLGAITGPNRDLDVCLLKFDHYGNGLPPEIQRDLQPLHDFLVKQQRRAHRALVKELTSQHFRTLSDEWRKYLESPEAINPETQPAAEFPVRVVADQRIGKMYRRALKEGNRINEDSPAEDLHELRKTCKKLRYLLEFFQSLYPRKEISLLIKALKGLQDILGEFQDLEIHAHALWEFSREMGRQRPVPPETLLAMGMMVEGLQNRQKQVRGEFSAGFAAFAGPENYQLICRLFGKEPQIP